MDDTTTQELTDEDIRTVLPGTAESPKAETDPDTKDQDGTDGDTTDGRTGTPAIRTGPTARTPTGPTAETRTGPTARREPRHARTRRGAIARRSSGAPATPGRSSRTTGGRGRRSRSASRADSERRVRGPALARRRRPVPDDDRARDAVLPPREGGRADRRVGVHAHRVAPVRGRWRDRGPRLGSRRSSRTARRSCSRACIDGPSRSRDSAGASSWPSGIRARSTPTSPLPGRRAWTCTWTRTTSSSCRRSAASDGSCTRRRAKRTRDPLDVEVAAGDTIYLPAGTPHAARAQDDALGPSHGRHPRDADGVTCSTGVVAREAGALDDAVPAGWLDDRGRVRSGAPRAARGARRRARRRRRADGGRRAPRAVPLDPGAAGARHDRRANGARSRWTTPPSSPAGPAPSASSPRRPDRLVVLLGDRRLEMPAWLEPAMRQIARLDEDDELVVRDLALHLPDPASRAVLVRRLVREGLLTIRDGR